MKTRHLLPLLPILLTGCGVLSPVEDMTVHHVLEAGVPYRRPVSSTPSVAINRPAIPDYLDREGIVTRTNGRLMISELDIWGEPLDAAIGRVTSSNLSRLTGSMNIQPVEDFVTLDYSLLLEIRITRFDPDESGHMIFEGTWKLSPVSGGDAQNHYFRLATAILPGPQPMAARVDAMDEALEQLARTIAKSL
jgi:uncharacterized protein